MSLEIKSIDELQELLELTSIEIDTIEELQDLLLTINQSDMTPELLKERLSARSSRDEQELAQEERFRQMLHQERLLALQKGIVLPENNEDVTETLSEATLEGSQIARSISNFAVLATFAGAATATYFLTGHFEISPMLIAIMGIVWGTAGLVSLVAVVLSIVTIRRRLADLVDSCNSRTSEIRFAPKSPETSSTIQRDERVIEK